MRDGVSAYLCTFSVCGLTAKTVLLYADEDVDARGPEQITMQFGLESLWGVWRRLTAVCMGNRVQCALKTTTTTTNKSNSCFAFLSPREASLSKSCLAFYAESVSVSVAASHPT